MTRPAQLAQRSRCTRRRHCQARCAAAARLLTTPARLPDSAHAAVLAQAKAEAKKNKQPPKKNVNVHFHIADDQAELDFKKADGSPYTAKMLLDDMAGAGDADKGGSLVDGPNGPFTDIFPDFVVLNRDGAAELAKKVRALTTMLLSRLVR